MKRILFSLIILANTLLAACQSDHVPKPAVVDLSAIDPG
jgi:hypothetical protein